jgi:hypothetical protein
MKTQILLMFLLVPTSLVQAQEVIHCFQATGDANGGTLAELIVNKNTDGTYSYHAQRCLRFHGSSCIDGPDNYESSGVVEREYFGEVPTLIFKNSSVIIRPECGRVQAFFDIESGEQLNFMRFQCLDLDKSLVTRDLE